MNVRIEKIASLVLVSLMALGIVATSVPVAVAQYPPLPLMYVLVSGNTADIYLLGDGFTDLDPYWDINGIDLVLRFDPYRLQALDPGDPMLIIDPDMWFASFWMNTYYALPVPGYKIDNTLGYVRIVIVGIPYPGGAHVAPWGQGRLMTVTFNNPITTPLRLEKMPPERAFWPPFGPEFFALDLAQFGTGMPVPFVGGGMPIARFTVSDNTPVANQPVMFDGTSSYHPTTIVLYEWDFDSNSVVDATGPTATHAYSSPGFHKATLKVTDYLGNTDTFSALILCNTMTLLQNAGAEHKVYDVSADEDMFNTLTVTARNLGTAAGDVKAVFSSFDKRTGMPVGPVLTAMGTVPANDRLDLVANFNPSAFGWEPGTEAGYEVTVEMSFFDVFTEAWTPVDNFKITFKVVP